jgi:hypothetical protein
VKEGLCEGCETNAIEEIEAAIDRLPREQFFHLVARLRGRFEDEWDRKIEEDVQAGRLDSFVREALTEYRAGRTKPFPPNEEPCGQ